MAISSSKDLIVFPNDNSGRVYIKEQSFTSNSTWTVPSGVTSAQIVLVGGGGGGGGGSDIGAGGGGAGGAVVVRNVDVTPGTTYAVNIGAGGQGGQGSLIASNDYTNTLPGGNGGTTTFGNITIANILTNSNFDYNFTQWDGDVTLRYATGVNATSAITVFPNANGLTAGMLVLGTNIGSNAQIVSISGNIVTLSAANTGTVGGVIRIDQGTVSLRQGSIFYNNVSNGAITSNAMGLNAVASPNTQFLSNNLLMPQVAQLEDPTTLTSNYIRVFGTNPATLTISNAGVPTKLAEMQVPITRTASAALGTSTLTMTDTTNLQPGMFVVGAGIANGTVILSVDSLTAITISNATTGTLSSTTLTFSYTGTFGLNALLAATGSAVSTSNPTWINWSSLAGSTTSVTTSVTTSSSGFQGIPYQPGQTYTLSCYISASVDVQASTPLLFQLRSTGATYGAATGTSYNTGNTNSGTTSSIDAGQANGFFVRQQTPAMMTNYGGTVNQVGTAANGSTTLTLVDATGVYASMAVTGTGIANGTTISSITGTTVTLSAATTAAITAGTITFSAPTGVQIIGSNKTPGQTGWRRISATFANNPALATVTALGVYGYGSTPQFIYPTIVLQQPSTNFYIDNIQLEVGSSVTTYQQPLYAFDNALVMSSISTAGSNAEVAHRPVKAVAGTVYSGSAFVIAGGTANQYRPIQGFIEFLDRDYNVLSRSLGLINTLPINGVTSTTAQMPVVSIPVRVGVAATAPTNTAWMRFGVTQYQGAQNATATAMEHYLFYPQLEAAASPTILKRANDGTYVYAGQPGMSPIITAATVSAEGGGGGGTYNTTVPAWQYGMLGANNGGHAAGSASTANTLPVLAGGGGGAGGAGGNGYMYVPAPSNSTTYSYAGGWNSTIGSAFQSFPMRGNPGGAAVWQTSSAGGVANMPGYAGDGGNGLAISGLSSGSSLGITLGGGGGGAGWTGTTQFVTVPGKGQSGGGKGGGTWLVSYLGGTDYYARGIDGIANTGGGGGGGGGNLGNVAQTLINHASANVSVNYEAVTADNYKWTALYNATTAISAQAGFYGSNVLRVVIQDVGNAKVSTAWQSFPILPRTALVFPGVAARLTTAPSGITSTNFAGLPKRVRPTVRWKTAQGVLIREDRPGYDIQFAGVNTVTYLSQAGATAGGWQTVPAPDNAAYFDVCWELLYLDAGDVVDLDFAGCQYYGYRSDGGNGADGLAIIRWFDKAVL